MNPNNAEFREVDIAELRRVLDYDPKTGVLTWKVRLCRGIPVGTVAGCIDPTTGYMRVGLFGTIIYAHRIAWALYYGTWPSTLLDHRDRCKTNNRIKNLRLATVAQNSANAKPTKNKSGYRGVFWHPNGKWFAAITQHGKQRHLGMFSDPKEAHEAYERAARELHGEFAYSDGAA